MAEYRNRLHGAVVEAVRFDSAGEHRLRLPDGVTGVPSPGADNWGYEGCEFRVETWNGPARVRDGDWVVKYAAGAFWVCTPEQFEMTFEPMLEAVSHG